ncbi:cytochrome c biogenesis protein CcdA [Alkalicella caledoniensis]|uniref:Cytochrome c biogenesis protein CcdA n=1 Tax=Alkalicella caledoniensis TaxID=2731377 RepID=A0A7G9WC81_ALKCA|nr:cytochrome c biogenesis CcdA family protein [Alkalicella caledoniensis]QNO16293.1 cytochrome c biogenesis protein CcdA [Alkalicella caledoniensis]
MEINFYIAFGAGVVSILSPCIFPLLPSLFAQMVAFNPRGKKLILFFNTVSFILGFSIIFILLGGSASILGRVIYNTLGVLRRIGGMFIVLMGLNMVGIINLNLFPVRSRVIKKHNSYGGSFLLGVVLAGGWLPCVGPVLASILVLGSNSATVYEGMFLLSFYCLGFSLPIFVSMMFFGSILNISKLNKYLPLIQRISGIILIVVGILVFFDYLSIISIWLGGIW